MNKHFQSVILKATSAKSLFVLENIQTLWSGYGEIVRYGLIDCEINTVIVKHVRLPDQGQHPRGWNTDLSHQRKIKSYQVEMAWYKKWSHLCNTECRIPNCLAVESHYDEMFMLLEDLDSAGFPLRQSNVSTIELKACLSWLANFHATFMGKLPEKLWEQGTYWHLETRPDELAALEDNALKEKAEMIDQRLRTSSFQTFVHGDAKLANFCFSKDGRSVAAVDFQYVGGGCGMKDVAYLIGSCFDDKECESNETELLDYYFLQLKQALTVQQKRLDFDALEQEWRTLFPVAWTDFHRFIKGWSPGHWKINNYSERMAREVIAQLNSTIQD